MNGIRFSVQVMRKLAMRAIRTSTRPVLNHPFLVGGFLFVVLLNRSFPFLFSLLMSASPVLVCTAVLLGTLLSFGHPQIPEIDKDDNVSNEKMSSLRAVPMQNKTTAFQEAVVFARDYPNMEIGRRKSVDKGNEGVSLLGDVFSVGKSKQVGLSTWNSQEIVFEPQCVIEAAINEYKSREVVITNGDHEKKLVSEATPSTYEVLGKTFENGGSPEGSVDGHMDDHDHFEPSSMPWARVNGDEEDEEEDEEEEEASDSGFDGAESSSSEPSLADIIPLLDEIHPLIECENSLNRSHSSNVSSINSDEETDHKEVEDEEAVDADDEEENQANKEDAEKSAITWTEDDHKNLMDLGSSELERNRRLESLIVRRIARRSMKMTNERNLIDLDGFDLPFQVPTISTTRQNPFAFPNVTYDNMGLPPIPGSAPSILLPRRNPFDLPYDSSEEKPDLTGDSFQQEFVEITHKEPVFRRHESFHIGSSFFDPRKEGRDGGRASRLTPFFVSECMVSEGTSYSSLMRQSSEISESLSFQRQTSELTGSSSFCRQTSGLIESSSYQRQSSDMSESSASSAAEFEPVPAEGRVPDFEMELASLHVERGSESSDIIDDQYEDRDSDLHMPEIRLRESETRTSTDFNQAERGHIVEISLGNNLDVDAWNLAASVANNVEEIGLMAKQDEEKHDSSSSSSSSLEHDDVQDVDEIGFNLMLETLEEDHISSSSSSLLSEEDDNKESLKHDEAVANMEHIRPDVDDNSDGSTEQALAASNSSDTMDLDDTHCEEPVYDSSPRASKNHLSVSSEHLLEEFAELDDKDVKQEIDGLLGKDDGDTAADELNLSAIEEGNAAADAAEEHSSSAQADLVSLATEEPESVNEDSHLSDEAGKSVTESVNVPAFVEKKQIPDPYRSDYQEESFVIPDTLEGVNKTELQVVEPEPSEIIEQPCVENAGKSAIDVSFVNTSVDDAEVGEEENKAGINILDAEPIKSIKQSSDENAEKSAPAVNKIEPKVENADAGTDEFSDSHAMSRAVEPECRENFEENLNNENAEIFGTIESHHLLDNLVKAETVVGSTKDPESPLTSRGNASVLVEDDPIVQIP